MEAPAHVGIGRHMMKKGDYIVQSELLVMAIIVLLIFLLYFEHPRPSSDMTKCIFNNKVSMTIKYMLPVSLIPHVCLCQSDLGSVAVRTQQEQCIWSRYDLDLSPLCMYVCIFV